VVADEAQHAKNPLSRTDRVVPLSSEQATLYEAVVRETMAQIEGQRGHRAARPGARAAHHAQADL